MNSLRPNSVCDTTPLKRLESLSSCSEPSSPTSNGDVCVGVTTTTATIAAAVATVANGDCLVGVKGLCATGHGSDTTTSSSTTTTSTTLSLNNHHINNYNNNNNKSEKSLNIFGNSAIGGGGGNVVIALGAGNKHKMEFFGTRKICGRLLVDLIILACVGLPIVGFRLWGESYKRGFFCNDDSLMHPYRESTVASWMLYLMCFLIPISMITIVEFFKSNSHKMHTFGNLSSSNYYFLHLEIPDWMVECYKRIGLLIFGSGVCELTTDIAKYSIGRLRPHFFAVCQPILPDGSTCDNPLNEGHYIQEFTCRGLGYTTKILKEAHLSFPSAHASFTCFTMIYIAIYLHKRLTCPRSKMFKHLLQFLFLMFAWYTSLTRVSDYKHHWTDVLAGSLIGSLYAIIVTCSMW